MKEKGSIYSSKLIKLFESLSKSDRIMFKKWILSPFFNKRKDIINLFNYLYSKKYLSENNTEKALIWKKVYPKAKYNDGKLRHLASMSTKLIEDFLIYREQQNQNNRNKLILAKIYRKMHLDKYAYHILFNDLSDNYKDISFELDLEEERYLEINYNRRNIPFNYQKISNLIHTKTIIDILKYKCFSYSHEQISNINYQFPFFSGVMHLIESDKGYLNNNIIWIYYNIYTILSNESKEDVFILIFEKIKTIDKVIPFFDIRDIYLLVINYTIKKLNSGKTEYANYAFQLYKDGIEKKYLLNNNKLSRFTFTNAVFVGLILRKELETKQFILSNKNLLENNIKEDTVNFNLSRLYFSQKNYSACMQILSVINFKDIYWNLAAKVMLLKIYFETKEWDALESFISSFKTFVKRQTKIGYHKKRFIIIIDYIHKLYKCEVANYSKSKKQLLYKQILSNKTLPDKEWFIEQIH